jgi:iron complex transport system permease protein
MKPKRNTLLLFLTLTVLLMAAIVVSLLFGGSKLGLPQFAAAILHPATTDVASSIVWQIRFPRILLGLFAGMGLAASGCVFQGMLRNPLADPYTLGVSGGAALGATIGIVTGLSGLHVFFLPFCAFLGTMASITLVYTVARRRHFSLHTLILSGVIIGFICSSLVLLIFAVVNAEKVHSALLWLMGDLSSADDRLTGLLAILVPAGLAALILFSRDLDLLTLGDEKAAHLGMDTVRSKKILFITASFITAACVAATGMIGFVGLMLPHFMRRFTGPGHRVLLPAAALAGGTFLILCDMLARTMIAPLELPVGVITGFIGGIFFLIFLLKGDEQHVF